MGYVIFCGSCGRVIPAAAYCDQCGVRTPLAYAPMSPRETHYAPNAYYPHKHSWLDDGKSTIFGA